MLPGPPGSPGDAAAKPLGLVGNKLSGAPCRIGDEVGHGADDYGEREGENALHVPLWAQGKTGTVGSEMMRLGQSTYLRKTTTRRWFITSRKETLRPDARDEARCGADSERRTGANYRIVAAFAGVGLHSGATPHATVHLHYRTGRREMGGGAPSSAGSFRGEREFACEGCCCEIKGSQYPRRVRLHGMGGSAVSARFRLSCSVKSRTGRDLDAQNNPF